MQWFGYDLAKRESFPIVAGMQIDADGQRILCGLAGQFVDELERLRTGHEAKIFAGDIGCRFHEYAAGGALSRLSGHDGYDPARNGSVFGREFDIASDEIDGMSIRAAGDYAIWRTYRWRYRGR